MKFVTFFFRLLGSLLKLISAAITLFTGLLFLLLLLGLLGLFFTGRTVIPEHCALVLNPAGAIVEHASPMDPLSRIMNRFAKLPVARETLLQDIQNALRHAAADPRIKLLVIEPSAMEQVGLDQLQSIGQAITEFKKSGKPVLAGSDNYTQAQYYLAVHADKVFLNPMGRVELTGMGFYRLYGRELLDRLRINFHTFKVGSYKSALEPFTRNNMSDADREASSYWLTRLWRSYRDAIGAQRGQEGEEIDTLINNTEALLSQAEGNSAAMALAAGLVDGLQDDQEFRNQIAAQVGPGKKPGDFLQVSLADYVADLPAPFEPPAATGENKAQIGLIIAEGNIMDGHDAPGQIGSTDLIEKIRKARENPEIRALVLRINSGGGSAFASEQIRRELQLVQKAGKPLVISMGSLAASGAYWLSADADAIIASPVTLTGSIGIFGAIPTFENSLAAVGIYSDGLSTTRFGGGINLSRDLHPDLAAVIQLGVDAGYRQFLRIVSEGRKIPLDEVEALAQGRVWDGATALDKGLVDALGDLDDALNKAAELTGTKDFQPVLIEGEDDQPGAALLRQLGAFTARGENRLLQKILPEGSTWQDLHFLLLGGDPKGIYAHSLLGTWNQIL